MDFRVSGPGSKWRVPTISTKYLSGGIMTTFSLAGPLPRGGSGVKSSIHMNLYGVYVDHIHLIENSTHFRKKEPPSV